VGDSAAMARNIVDIWKGNQAATARDAIAAAARFDWEVVMSELFGGFYPRALRERVAPAPSALAVAST